MAYKNALDLFCHRITFKARLCLRCSNYCIRYASSKSYTDTVLVGKSSFPAAIFPPESRPEHDSYIHEKMASDDLYAWQFKQEGRKLFILHDGPPYANGNVHMGHALNKILKDIIIRFKLLRGFRIHYVPGWDCHGLPIEHKVLKAGDTERLQPLEIRKIARQFALETVTKQQTAFQQWGIIGDWKHKYLSLTPEYIAKELEAFWICHEKGLIYRDLKPVFWSPSSRSTMADGELEYKTIESKSVYVELDLLNYPENWKSITNGTEISLLIWTTTPWTLPANQAVAFSENQDYCLVKKESSQKVWILAKDLISSLENLFGSKLCILHSFPGKSLKNCSYLHPFKQSTECVLLHGDHVLKDKGTGLVHTAPNHGVDDFNLARKAGLSQQSTLVDGKGCFVDEAGPELVGAYVLSEGTEKVLKALGNKVAFVEMFTHSYPHDWRTKEPVIIRAIEQWFIRVQAIKNLALESLNSIAFHPEARRNSLRLMLENCPDWCISRQRSWGVPLPMFYHPGNGQPIISRPIINHFCALAMKHGGDFWWSLSENELLPEDVLLKSGFETGIKYMKSSEILDIWFDSGVSWFATKLPESEKADLYLEGHDQFRGWFRSSLLTSIAIRGISPYKSLYIHGFALDQSGEKMSKSLGNVIDPKVITHGKKDIKKNPPYGVNTLRWWMANNGALHSDCDVTKESITECFSNVNKIRNVYKFLLSNIHDFSFENHESTLEEMNTLDRYQLHSLNSFNLKVLDNYENFKFKDVAVEISKFFYIELSALYFPAIKDRLYCEAHDSPTRRSCQTTLHHILEISLPVIAPILPHLVEEVRLHHPEMSLRESVFRSGWVKPNSHWENQTLQEAFSLAKSIKSLCNLNLNPSSSVKRFDLEVIANGDLLHLLKNFQNEDGKSSFSDLCYLLEAASTQLSLPEELGAQRNAPDYRLIGENIIVHLKETSANICERCRRRTTLKENVCARCTHVLNRI